VHIWDLICVRDLSIELYRGSYACQRRAHPHKRKHERFDFGYCYAKLSHLRSAKYRISIARAYLPLLAITGSKSDVRLSSLRVIERDFVRRGKNIWHKRWWLDTYCAFRNAIFI